MSGLRIPLSTNAQDDRAVGVLLQRDDARLLMLVGGRRGVLQRALSAFPNVQQPDQDGAERGRKV